MIRTFLGAVWLGMACAVAVGCDARGEHDGVELRQATSQPGDDDNGPKDTSPFVPESEADIDCEGFWYDEPVEAEGIGWSPGECRSNAFSAYPPDEVCIDTAWDEGNCLHRECPSHASQCVSSGWGWDFIEAASMGGAMVEGFSVLHQCEFDPPLDPHAPFDPLGPFTCKCRRTITCSCECEACDPD